MSQLKPLVDHDETESSEDMDMPVLEPEENANFDNNES